MSEILSYIRMAGSGAKRYQLILSLIFAATSLIYLFVIHQMGIETEVMKVYFPYADELMRGSLPEMEYPPFALVFIAIPRLFATTPFGYNAAFVAEVFIFFIIGLVVIGKLAKRYNQSQHKAMLIYTILMLLMFEFVVDRYDIFPAIITLLSLYCLATKRYVWAFVLLSIATMTKLYPAVLFPIYLIPFFMNRDWSNILKGIGAFVFTALIIVLPFIIMDTGATLHFISYHMDRPLHIESIVASFISLANIFGITDIWIMFSYGSDNMFGSWPDAVAPYLTPIMLALIFVVYALYAYMLSKLRKENRDNENDRLILLSGALLLSLMVFIIVGKVFSAQYLIWLIPFIVFMMMVSIDHVTKNRIFWLFVSVIGLTQLNFIVNIGISGGGDGITDVGMMIILVRNVVMIILFLYILWVLNTNIYKRYKQSPSCQF